MGKPRVPLDPLADLKRRLTRLRALPTPKLRACVRTWWTDHDFDKCPATVGKRVAFALLDQRSYDAKRAGLVVLADLRDQLRATDLPAFATLVDELADADLVDRLAARVLARVAVRGPDSARQLASWRAAESVWRRRAACLAFAKAAPAEPGLVPLALGIAASVVWSIETLDQLAVGVLLRELVVTAPERVDAFIRRYARLMTKRCARCAVATFPPSQRAGLLAHHRRATTLR